MKVLVTGGRGFIGSHLVSALEKAGKDVAVMDIKDGKGFDIRKYENVDRLINGCDAVFHLAAISNIFSVQKNPIHSSDVNVGGTLNVIEAAKKHKAKIIFISSAAVYGDQSVMPLKETVSPNPINLYGLQKYFGELYCKMAYSISGVKSVCLRYFNVYGPGHTNDNVIFSFLKNKYSGKPFLINGSGDQSRSFVYVDDVVDATIKAAESGIEKSDVINVGTDKEYTILEVAKILNGKIKKREGVEGDIRRSLSDITKAKKMLNWAPKISLEEGLVITEKWFSSWRKNKDIG